MLRLNSASLRKKARLLGDELISDIARRAQVDASTLHRLAGGTQEPSLATLWALRKVYGGRLDSYVVEDDQVSRPSVPSQRKAPARGRRRAAV